MAEFTMPSLGADMEEGTLLEWLVHPGDVVAKGDVVAVVDTAKAAVEVECFSAGVVERLLVEPGTRVAVGTPLAVIESGTVEQSSPAAVQIPLQQRAPRRSGEAAAVRSPLVRHEAEAQHVDLRSVTGTGPGGAIRRSDLDHLTAAAASVEERPPDSRPRVTPYARRLAKERGIDVDELTGSGSAGEVRARDLEAGPAASPPAATRQPAADDQRMRDAIAKLMSRSKREIPHYYLRSTVDLAAATEWLREHNRTVPVADRVVLAALLLTATSRAAVDVPELNAYWQSDRLQRQPSVHLGVAVSLRSGGMVTPAIHDAQSLTPTEMMSRLKDLVQRARAGRLKASELTDATLTVTNLGEQGVEEVLGVIYPPQVALVGFGTVVERPWAVGGLIGVRPVVTMTLSADHRASDGYLGARLLNRIDHLLQRPEEL